MMQDTSDSDSFVMRQDDSDTSGGTPPAASGESAASETGGQTTNSIAKDVAERVYRIFCENLRIERERRGY